MAPGSGAPYSHDSVRDTTSSSSSTPSARHASPMPRRACTSMDDALRPEQAGLARAVGEARAAEGLRLEQQAAWAPPVEEAEAAPSRYRDAVAARHGMARVRQLQGADGRRTPPPYGSRNQSDMGTEGPCWPPASRSMAQGTPRDLPYLKVEWSGHESNEVYNSFAQTCFRGRA